MKMLDKNFVILAQWNEEDQKWYVYDSDTEFLAKYEGSITDKQNVEAYAPIQWRKKKKNQLIPQIFYNNGTSTVGI